MQSSPRFTGYNLAWKQRGLRRKLGLHWAVVSWASAVIALANISWNEHGADYIALYLPALGALFIALAIYYHAACWWMERNVRASITAEAQPVERTEYYAHRNGSASVLGNRITLPVGHSKYIGRGYKLTGKIDAGKLLLALEHEERTALVGDSVPLGSMLETEDLLIRHFASVLDASGSITHLKLHIVHKPREAALP